MKLSRFFITLSLGLFVVTAAAQVDAETAMAEAWAAEDWRAAGQAALFIAKNRPADPVAAYNLACALSRLGETSSALDELERSIALGFDRPDHMAADDDLAGLQTEAGFSRLIAAAKQNQQARLDDAVTAASHRPAIVWSAPGHNRRAKAPVIVVLHGYGGDADNLAALHRPVAEALGAVLIVPRAIHAVEGAGWRWDSVDETKILIDAALSYVARPMSAI